MFGAPAITSMPCAFAAWAAAMVTGNSLIRMPSAAFSATSSSVLSSWLASAMARPSDTFEQRAAVRNASRFALCLQFLDALFDVAVVQAASAAQRAIKIDVGILSDAWAVIHQADDAHQRMVGNRVEQRQHVERRHFAAQVQEVLCLQQSSVIQRIEIDDAVLEGADPVLVEPKIAKTQRVEHSGDAGSGALRIMRDHGGARRPARQRARLHLAFQVVRMDIHDTGDQIVAIEVMHGECGGPAGLHVDDRAAAQHQRAMQHRIGQDQDCIGQDRFVGHAASCEGGNGEQPVGDAIAYVRVVADGDDGGAARLRLVDHCHHNRTIVGVERCRRFVEQQDRMTADEATREVDPLLLAAREGGGRQGVQAGAGYSVAAAGRSRCCRLPPAAPARDQHLCHHVERRHARGRRGGTG